MVLANCRTGIYWRITNTLSDKK